MYCVVNIMPVTCYSELESAQGGLWSTAIRALAKLGARRLDDIGNPKDSVCLRAGTEGRGEDGVTAVVPDHRGFVSLQAVFVSGVRRQRRIV